MTINAALKATSADSEIDDTSGENPLLRELVGEEWNQVLTSEDRLKILRMVFDHRSLREIAQEFGVHKMTIWRHIQKDADLLEATRIARRIAGQDKALELIRDGADGLLPKTNPAYVAMFAKTNGLLLEGKEAPAVTVVDQIVDMARGTIRQRFAVRRDGGQLVPGDASAR